MYDYAQRIIAEQHASELLREAENERLARRARVHRDGSISFARKLFSAASAGVTRFGAAARSAASPNTDRLAGA